MPNEAQTSKSKDPNFWFNLAVENFIVQGKSKRTAETYARELRMLTRFYDKPLNTLTEDEIRKYIVYRKVDCKLHSTSMRILLCGLRFLYEGILEMKLPLLDSVGVQTERSLPDVLTRKEVIGVLNHLSTFHRYVFFRTIYTCGLRVSEALNLQVEDIDGTRFVLKVNGKGGKERYVPLPPATYELLKLYWKTHKNRRLLFPALGRDLRKGPISKTPMVLSGVQNTLKDAARSAGIKPTIVRPHVLRHSYATHLLESGVSTYECVKCGEQHTIYRSCGNRNCPVCQYNRNTQWFDERMKQQLSGPYFMVTFTIPEEIRGFMRSSQRTA